MLVTLGSLPTVRELLICVLAMGFCVSGKVCPDGWFGDNCDFECNCLDHCDFEDDICYHCQYGFFGPSCQYYDAVYWYGSITNPSYLMTRNTTLCNPSSHATFVKLTFTTNVRLSWFRLHVNDENVLNKFQVKLNNQAASCAKERRYNLTTEIVDVTCDTMILVKVLTLEGPVAPNVCTIYVSAGRNIALKQVAQQSSTVSPNEINKATNAVDGIRNPDNALGFCSQTEAQPRIPEWSVTLPLLSVLYMVQVYSSDADREMYLGFTLSTHGANGDLVERYASPASKDAVIQPYIFILQSHLPVLTVKIRGNPLFPLSMCEVNIFGDYICSDLSYGLSCEKECQCKGHELCHAGSGSCGPGCPYGFYGFQCSSPCNSSCGGDPCLQVSGKCYRCPPGYKGSDCNEDCSSGTYGESCEETCSANCINECDPVDGYCECSPGYRQPKCTECNQGKYGSRCALNCSSSCLNRKCHPVTGMCIACEGQNTGLYCEECPKGKFGVNCTLNCSEYCADRKCDPVTGHCIKCVPGRIGPFCTECPANHYGYTCSGTCPTNCRGYKCNVVTGVCLSCADNYIGPTCSKAVGYRSNLVYFSPLAFLLMIPLIIFLLRKKRRGEESTSNTVVTSEGMSCEGENRDSILPRPST